VLFTRKHGVFITTGGLQMHIFDYKPTGPYDWNWQARIDREFNRAQIDYDNMEPDYPDEDDECEESEDDSEDE
jgi:hypothetical protein